MKEHLVIRSVCAAMVTITLVACSETTTSPSRLPGRSVAPGQSTADADRATVSNAPAPDSSTQNFEIKFMTDMIDHHQMAIETSEICVAKAVHSELRSLCQQIIAAQSAEIEEMQSWLQKWYGVTYEPSMKPRDQQMLDRLRSLTGSEFEIAFMEMMIEHHAKAVAEGERCLARAAHRQLRDLCENIIATQTQEIEQMEMWLCSWYGRCE